MRHSTGISVVENLKAFSRPFYAFCEHIGQSCAMLRPPGVEEICQENYSKVRLTRAKYDFDVSVPKISPFRFSTTLISVEYLITVKIHRPGHHPLNNQWLLRILVI